MLFVWQHEIVCQKNFDLGFRVLKMQKEKAFHHTRVCTLNFWRPTNNFNNVVSQVKAFRLLMHQCVQIERHACDDPKVWNLTFNWPMQ